PSRHSSSLRLFMVLLPVCPAHLLVPSFPTRRSSDLHGARHAARRAAGGGAVGPRLDPPRLLAVEGGARAVEGAARDGRRPGEQRDRKSTRLNSSHGSISYAVFCLQKKRKQRTENTGR